MVGTPGLLKLTPESDSGFDHTDGLTNKDFLSFSADISHLSGVFPNDELVFFIDGIEVMTHALTQEEIDKGQTVFQYTKPFSDGVYRANFLVRNQAGSETALSTPCPFTVTHKKPLAPFSVSLKQSHDTGYSTTDSLTSKTRPSIEVDLANIQNLAQGHQLHIVDTQSHKTYLHTLTGQEVQAKKVTFDFPTELSTGAHRVEVSVIDGEGNEGGVTAHLITVDSQPPAAPSYILPLLGNGNIGALPRFKVGLPVGLKVGDHVNFKDKGGQFLEDRVLSGKDLQNGYVIVQSSHFVSPGQNFEGSISFHDMAGNAGQVVPTGRFPISGGNFSILGLVSDQASLTNDPTPSLSALLGSGVHSGDEILLYDEHGVEVGRHTISTLEQGNGIAKIEPRFLPDGSHQLTSKVYRQAEYLWGTQYGSAVALEVDTILGEPRGVQLHLPAGQVAKEEGKAIVIATASPGFDMPLPVTGIREGDMISLYEAGSPAKLLQKMVLTSENVREGKVRLVSSSSFSDGKHSVYAKIEDQAGNSHTGIRPLEFTVDTKGHLKPTVTMLRRTDTGISQSDQVSTDRRLGFKVQVGATDSFSGGDAVVLLVDGKEVLTQSLQTGDISRGYAEVFLKDFLGDGAHEISTYIRDAAGNIGEFSMPLRVDIRITSLEKPAGVYILPQDDTGLRSNDGITQNLRPTFRVSLGTLDQKLVKDGLWLTIQQGGMGVFRQKLQAEDVLRGFVDASLTRSLPEGRYPLEFNFEDRAGRVSADPLREDFTFSLAEPSKPASAMLVLPSGEVGGDVTREDRPTLQVNLPMDSSTELGERVELWESGKIVGFHDLTEEDIQHGFTNVKTSSTLNEGTHAIEVKMRSQAGVVSGDAIQVSFSSDRTRPASPLDISFPVGTIDHLFPKVKILLPPNSEVGDTVEIFINGADRPLEAQKVLPLDQTNGFIEVSLEQPLLDGNYDLNARLIDKAGNEGLRMSKSVSFKVDTERVTLGGFMLERADRLQENGLFVSASTSVVAKIYLGRTIQPGAELQVKDTFGGNTKVVYPRRLLTSVERIQGYVELPLRGLVQGSHRLSTEMFVPGNTNPVTSPEGGDMEMEVRPNAPVLGTFALTQDGGSSATDGKIPFDRPQFKVTFPDTEDIRPGDVVMFQMDGVKDIGRLMLTDAMIADKGAFFRPNGVIPPGVHEISAQVHTGQGVVGTETSIQVEVVPKNERIDFDIDLVPTALSDSGKIGDRKTSVPRPHFRVSFSGGSPVKVGDFVDLYIDGNKTKSAAITAADLVASYIDMEGSFTKDGKKYHVSAVFRTAAGSVSQEVRKDFSYLASLSSDVHTSHLELLSSANGEGSSEVTTSARPTVRFFLSQSDRLADGAEAKLYLGQQVISHQVIHQTDWLRGYVDVPVGQDLPSGNQQVVGKLTDVVGIEERVGVSLAFMVDDKTSKPTSLDLLPASDTGVKGDGKTESEPVFEVGIPSTAEVGGHVEIRYQGLLLGYSEPLTIEDIKRGTVSVALMGGVSIPEGKLDIEARIVNKAGKKGDIFSFVLDYRSETPGPWQMGLLSGQDTGVVGDAITKNTAPTMNIDLPGNAKVGDTITFYDGETPLGTPHVLSRAEVRKGGAQIPLAKLAEGSHTIHADFENRYGKKEPAGSPVFVHVSSEVPVIGTIQLDSKDDTGHSDHDGLTNKRRPHFNLDLTSTLQANLEEGAVVHLLVDGKEMGQTKIGQEAVLANALDLLLDHDLSDGPHTVKAYIKSVSGVDSAMSNPVRIAVDTTPPAPASLLGLAPGDDSGVRADDWITRQQDPSVRIDVSKMGDGDDVTLSLNGHSKTFTVNQQQIQNKYMDVPLLQLLGSGVQSMADGSYPIELFGQDEAGNKVFSGRAEVRIDTKVAPSQMDGSLEEFLSFLGMRTEGGARVGLDFTWGNHQAHTEVQANAFGNGMRFLRSDDGVLFPAGHWKDGDTVHVKATITDVAGNRLSLDRKFVVHTRTGGTLGGDSAYPLAMERGNGQFASAGRPVAGLLSLSAEQAPWIYRGSEAAPMAVGSGRTSELEDYLNQQIGMGEQGGELAQSGEALFASHDRIRAATDVQQDIYRQIRRETRRQFGLVAFTSSVLGGGEGNWFQTTRDEDELVKGFDSGVVENMYVSAHPPTEGEHWTGNTKALPEWSLRFQEGAQGQSLSSQQVGQNIGQVIAGQVGGNELLQEAKTMTDEKASLEDASKVGSKRAIPTIRVVSEEEGRRTKAREATKERQQQAEKVATLIAKINKARNEG